LTTIGAKTPIPAGDEATHDGLKGPYATTCAPTPRGTAGPRGPALQAFGVSRHTLGLLMERGHLGRERPRAVIKAIGDDPGAIAAAVMGQAATDARPLTAGVPGWYANLMARSYPRTPDAQTGLRKQGLAHATKLAPTP